MPPTSLDSRRSHLLHIVLLLAVAICGAFALLWLVLASPLAALGSAAACAANLGVLWLVRRGHVDLGVAFMLLSQLAGLALSSWRLGGLEASTLMWLPFPIVLAIMLGPARNVWLTGLATVAVPVALALLPPAQDASEELLGVLRLVNIAGITITAILLVLSAERTRRIAQARLERTNQELSRARDAADAASRAKTALMANVSHELRTPLHAVVGMAEVLLRGPLTPAQQEQVRTARDAAQTLGVLVSDLLDAASLEARALTLSPAPCDLGEVVRRAVGLLRDRAESRGLTLRVELPNPSPRALCDAVRLRQIVVNLVENAVKFTDRGEVRVRLTTQDVEGGRVAVALEVEDTGVGIAPATLPTIFERFRQGDASSTRRHGGTGLGLSIVRDLATLMDGTVEARSTPGVGSTFTFRAHLPSVPAGDEGALRGRRVLLADDNAVNQRVAALMLESFGCTVDIAADGQQAVELASAHAYDVVLLDCHMPEMDGYRAAALIRARASAAPPILALTAASEDERARARAAGMVDVLRKPVSAELMRAALERALALPGVSPRAA